MAFVNLMSDLFGGLGQGFNTYNALNQQEIEKRARQQQLQEQQRQFESSQAMQQKQLEQQMEVKRMEDAYRRAALETEWNTRKDIAKENQLNRNLSRELSMRDSNMRAREARANRDSQAVDKLSTDYLTSVDSVNSIVRDAHSKAMQMIADGKKEMAASAGGVKLPSSGGNKSKSRELELAEWYDEQEKNGKVGSQEFTTGLLTRMGVDADIRKARERKKIAERKLARYGGLPEELSGYGSEGWFGKENNVDVNGAIKGVMDSINGLPSLTPEAFENRNKVNPYQREYNAKEALWERLSGRM